MTSRGRVRTTRIGHTTQPNKTHHEMSAHLTCMHVTQVRKRRLPSHHMSRIKPHMRADTRADTLILLLSPPGVAKQQHTSADCLQSS